MGQCLWECILKIYLILVFFSFFLSACIQKELDSPLVQQRVLTHYLQKSGINVVQVGDEITLILQEKDFFREGSNHFSGNFHTLDRIVDLINTYSTSSAQVRGYTANTGDYKRNLALSRAQAQFIATYLWRHQINVPSVFAEGYGCHHIYGDPHIEIFFRKIPPVNVFH